MGSNKNHESLRRQWLLLNRIPRRGRKGTKYFQEALQAAGFDVSLRTIQRDLKELSRYFPLLSDEERISGWQWSEDAPSFDIPGMDPQAALAFKMIEVHLSKMLPASCLNFLRPHSRHAEVVLQQLGYGGIAKWPDKVARISRYLTLEPPAVDPIILETIYDGLLLERQIEIAYCKRDSNSSQEGKIHPLGLVFVDNVIYLVCTFWEYKDLRQVALHRIESVRLLDEPAKRSADFNLQNYIDQGHFGIPQSEETIHLKCLFEATVAGHLEESQLDKNQILTEQDDGRIQLETKAHDTAQLRWWLLGFSHQVEVISPESLRSEMADNCRKMHNIYRDPEEKADVGTA
ncbi:MAG: WYL domain-containing protein [Thermodesulfobacteriota bacterium]|nr:WYL domain-containing protein [Thermodesulfobacteriota bacterium]